MSAGRLGRTAAFRSLAGDAGLEPAGLVQPIFIRHGADGPRPIESMPGQFQHSVASAARFAAEAAEAGIGAVMPFAIPSEKDELGTEASDPEGIMQRALRAIAEEVGDTVVVIGDVNLDEYTTHGHTGVLDAAGEVDNDASIASFARVAVAQADAGAAMVAPSGMMDGQVAAIRDALDGAGHEEVGIMAYAAKFASGFYGPFRGAVESSLTGNRRSYQQYPGNSREALIEAALDVEEGADIVMVKPALPYLDVIDAISSRNELPVAAYQVSGEYVMVEAAAREGVVDRAAAIEETLLAIRRAGATTIITYWATEFATSGCR